ncbi:JAB1/Mov34/MPN/PAD-1 [Cynara cardunculus var. scolymus]|uniref:JAB1/Mov34/MPN/PAD-1 n=1 Tax=Cynara cardunculus var. scolymus TaxID=59895 RepID=A0A124SC85_CYNCS|nr:JAB1/Mov34/MPN/PAD-1 [Cynara cardunculus var. scolymus]
MSLTSVKMAEDVWLTCLTHALSTETEEIMGLLLGDIQHSKNGSVTALIWGALPQPRSDRQKDRVETNPEQLTAASVWDANSEYDVRTQAMYQLLDSGFIGLIFSCFNEDQYKVGRIQVTAFQSLDGKQNHVLRPVPISPIHKSSIIDLESSVSSTEHSLTNSGSTRVECLELDTGDSKAAAGASKGGGKSSALKGFFANADTNYTGRVGGNYPTGNMDSAVVDIDPMDMSDSMQEAMHRSNMEMRYAYAYFSDRHICIGAEYIRKEVPLHVMPTLSLLNLESPLTSFSDLQSVLYEEERTAYHQAIIQNMSLSPAINSLQDRISENEIRLRILASEAKILEKESTKGTGIDSSSSPRSVAQRGGGKDVYSPFERSVSGSSSRSRRGS